MVTIPPQKRNKSTLFLRIDWIEKISQPKMVQKIFILHVDTYLQYSSPRYESPTETIAIPIPTRITLTTSPPHPAL